MNHVLYRKYRPQIFADIVGQEHIVRTLQNAVKNDRAAHAYLFTGPRGTGKTTIARLLAKAVNCESLKGAEPCTACEHCEEFASGSALDLIEIDAASNRGIDEIRELREGIRFAPNKASYKVFIIDEVHMLTREAFNALLKTVEEPPDHVIFVLATTEPHKVPETILSRVQRFDFRRIPVALIAKRLASLAGSEDIVVEEAARNLIASYAQGSMRDAESMLGQLMAAGDETITPDMVREMVGAVDENMIIGVMDAFVEGNAPAMLRTINELQEEGEDLQRYAEELARYLRGVRMLQEGAELTELLADEIPETLLEAAQRHADALDRSLVSALLAELLDAQHMMGRTTVMQLPLELALLNVLHGRSAPVQQQAQSAAQHAADDSQEQEVTASEEVSDDGSRDDEEDETTEAPAQIAQDTQYDEHLTVDAIKGAWSQVLDDIRPHNNALHAFLQAAEIKEVTDEGVLRLVVRYDFHKERLAVPKHRKLLLDILKDTFGRPLKVEFMVQSDGGAKDVVSSALKMLGGRLVK